MPLQKVTDYSSNTHHVEAAPLDGNGWRLSLDLGGERSTSAVDSLKVIAFDLTLLTLGLEGRIPMPAWLVHDSPRGADLGLSVYQRIFRLARDFAGTNQAPAFQYLVTTTQPRTISWNLPAWLRRSEEAPGTAYYAAISEALTQTDANN